MAVFVKILARAGRRGSTGTWLGAVCTMLVAANAAFGQSLGESLNALDAGQFEQAIPGLLALAEDGNATAQYRLGKLYYHGQGVPEDEKNAVFWWKKAAALGNANAMFEIANAYLFGIQAARLVADPDREAAIWYFQAASAGHAEAQYHLGLLFLAGKGVIESRSEARRWLRKAAAQEHTEARKALISIDKRGR